MCSHRGDSNEYIQYTIFNMNNKNTINYPRSAATGFFSKGLKNEFETAVVNEPSVFEPLKFYCTCNMSQCIHSVPIDHTRPVPRPEQQRLQPWEVYGMFVLTISYVYMGNRLLDFHINNKQDYE